MTTETQPTITKVKAWVCPYSWKDWMSGGTEFAVRLIYDEQIGCEECWHEFFGRHHKLVQRTFYLCQPCPSADYGDMSYWPLKFWKGKCHEDWRKGSEQ